ncbi:DUF2240 family protein [Pyrococcus horikoshii]|uniref:UPF0175 family protein n=1 Tax=Pyrococcus horikoshii TaxID=53953 RepID=A0A832T126_PYRHR|nr:UPF0175 family protein [Pyrococcus horikoshii]HII61824.1 UPF0175 family protein [Pyrococcus horikoshii]
MSKYKPLLEAVKVKGDNIFSSRSEIIGILAFKLGAMSVSEAKELIKEGIEEGIIEESEEGLIVKVNLIEEEEKKRDIFGEIVEYLAKELNLTELEVMEEIKRLEERYGNLDKKLLAYLYGLEKGLDMSKFKEELENGGNYYAED